MDGLVRTVTENMLILLAIWVMGFAVCAANTFGSKIRGLVKHKRIRSDGELCWVYIKE